MARILLTYQKPDETEKHEICTDEDFNSPPKNDRNVDGIVKDEKVESLLSADDINEASRLSVGEESNSSSNLAVKDSTRNSSLIPPVSSSASIQKRKLSFPTNLPSTFLRIESTGSAARRRFSNVSIAVTRKLSSTIGWKTSEKQSREIVIIGKSLCSQYIRSRLKRSGYSSKKCGLQRVRSALNLGGVVFRDVYTELIGLCVELERLHPKVYTNITRQASCLTGGKLSSEKEIGAIFATISRELMKNEITWGKIVALYAVAGGLAVDCTRQGHSEYLKYIVETMEAILEEELAQWILYKGGWHALAALVKPPHSKWPLPKINILAVLLIFAIVIFFAFLLYGYFKTSSSL